MDIEKSNELEQKILYVLMDLSRENPSLFFDVDTIRWRLKTQFTKIRYSINNKVITHILTRKSFHGKVQMKYYKNMRLFRYGKQR